MGVRAIELAKNEVQASIALQLVIALVIAAILGWLYDWMLASSFFVGAMTAVLPNVWFAYKLFSVTGARNARQIVRNMHAGAAGKFIATMLLFLVIFAVSPPLKPLPVFIGFISSLLLGLLVITRRTVSAARGIKD